MSALARRLSRLPMRVQWEATIDLAIAYAEGRAAPRLKEWIPATGEEHWIWRDAPIEDPRTVKRTGYWYVSPRIAKRVRILVADAIETARRRPGAIVSVHHPGCIVASILRQWQRSGRWQRRVPSTLARRDDALAEKPVLKNDQHAARATPQWSPTRTSNDTSERVARPRRKATP